MPRYRNLFLRHARIINLAFHVANHAKAMFPRIALSQCFFNLVLDLNKKELLQRALEEVESY